MPEIAHRLEVESLDLGTDVRAVLLELIDPQTREPVAGAEAARIWAAIIPALAAGEPWLLDFFAHLGRVRDFCNLRGIPFRETDVLVIEQPQAGQLEALIERFAGETFGVRAGASVAARDEIVEAGLVQRGVDAYQEAYSQVCILRGLRFRKRLSDRAQRAPGGCRGNPPDANRAGGLASGSRPPGLACAGLLPWR